MPDSVDRIRRLRRVLLPSVRVQFDGGVDESNVADLRSAGADVLVCGTSVFGAPDPAAAFRNLTRLTG